MPYLPKIVSAPQSRDVTDTFYGYNHRLKIRPGEFFYTENLSTKDYPMMSTRKRRGMVRRLAKPQGLLAKDKLCYVDNGTLYYGDEATPVTGLSDGMKQLVSMGAYICVFPDKVYYNTQDPTDYGNMECNVTMPGSPTYTLCTVSGEEIDIPDTKPDPPANGQYWYDREHNALKCWSSMQNEWVTVVTVYTKVMFSDYDGDLSEQFREYDGVEISGLDYDVLNGTKVLYGVGANYFVVVGLFDEEDEKSPGDAVTIARKLPDLDYVCECQNRLWGCYYGKSGDKMLNEIYCSALGDFKNWRQYMGLSTDSWTASVGSDGPWTGAINFLGYPTFFKETMIHRVTVSATGAHSTYDTPARGVQNGSGNSLAIVNEMLIYKSRQDVCAYQGGFPEGLSQALGDVQYSGATAGAFGPSYYVSMKDSDGWHLFVYNTNSGLWIREDDLHVLDFAFVGDSFYALDADGILWDLAGVDGEQETVLPWVAQTGILYYQMPNKKYTARYDVMLSAPDGSEVSAYTQYDSNGIWRYHGTIRFKGINSITFPIRPRRCNHMELRLEGKGDVKLFSIARILEGGSDE